MEVVFLAFRAADKVFPSYFPNFGIPMMLQRLLFAFSRILQDQRRTPNPAKGVEEYRVQGSRNRRARKEEEDARSCATERCS